MEVLVTGGAGFLGYHVCERLLEEGHHVLCIDNLSSGSLYNIEKLEQYNNFIFLKRDIKHLQVYDVDVNTKQIWNLACPASPPFYQSKPLDTLDTCYEGTKALLNIARHLGSTMLHFSTSEVYGDPEITPQTEEYWGHVNPVGKRACYDEGKRIAETLCREYIYNCGVDVRIVRIFNTYGPHMRKDDGRVISNFINQAINNLPITIYGAGKQTRSFCYVSDLIRGLFMYMNCPKEKLPKVPILNLGNPDEHTIEEVAKIILKLFPESASTIIYKELPEDDPKQRMPNIDKTKMILDWEPQMSFSDGLQKTLEYFKEINKN